MARTTRSETARRSRTSARTNRGMYVDKYGQTSCRSSGEKEAAGKTESGKAADQSKPKSAGESCAGTKAETSVE